MLSKKRQTNRTVWILRLLKTPKWILDGWGWMNDWPGGRRGLWCYRPRWAPSRRGSRRPRAAPPWWSGSPPAPPSSCRSCCPGTWAPGCPPCSRTRWAEGCLAPRTRTSRSRSDPPSGPPASWWTPGQLQEVHHLMSTVLLLKVEKSKYFHSPFFFINCYITRSWLRDNIMSRLKSSSLQLQPFKRTNFWIFWVQTFFFIVKSVCCARSIHSSWMSFRNYVIHYHRSVTREWLTSTPK